MANLKSVKKQGQNGPKLDIKYADLTAKERLVLGAIVQATGGITLGELAAVCFRGQPKEKANSWVRNQLRRLVRGGFVDPVSSGFYQATGKAKASARKVA